jgi:5-formyltetrahydrofolate cyclo-ligase
MEFYRIQSTDDLSVGSYGILEPDGSSEMYSGGALSLCVVPALSYDFSGYRLGFGKGYYDRFLADFDGEKVGLCYESCLIRSLPHDDFDICADWLVTENKFITFSKG